MIEQFLPYIGQALNVGANIFGSMLGGDSGDSSLPLGIKTYLEANKLTKQYIQMLRDQMAKQYGLMTGAGTPQELPWFRGFQEGANKQAQQIVDNLLREVTARGMRGGVVEQALQAPVTAATKGILGTISQAYQQAPSTLSDLGRQAVNIRNTALVPTPQTQSSQPQNTNWLSSLIPMIGKAGFGLFSGDQNKELINLLKGILTSGGTLPEYGTRSFGLENSIGGLLGP